MKFKLLICDLDNTLYDWVSYFVPSLYAMVDKAVEITGWDKEELLDDLKAVHQRHHDSEHPFALLETDLAKKTFPGENAQLAKDRLDEAFHAFNSYRKRKLNAYPNVHETLSALQDADIRIVAHTEARYQAVAVRLRQLGLIHYFDRVYCRKRAMSRHPENLAVSALLDDSSKGNFVELKHHQRKPNSSVLLKICEKMSAAPEETAYVGDSMAHDMMMAVEAGVFAIHAKYGTQRDAFLWDKLVRVTHWTDEDVKREALLREEAKSVQPDFTAENSFRDILTPMGLSTDTFEQTERRAAGARV